MYVDQSVNHMEFIPKINLYKIMALEFYLYSHRLPLQPLSMAQLQWLYRLCGTRARALPDN